MAPKLPYDRVQVSLYLDVVLHDYIRSLANLSSFHDRRSYGVTQMINDLITEAIEAREGSGDIPAASKRMKMELAALMGVDDVDAFNQTNPKPRSRRS